jgi:hypothetical protein
VLLLTGDSGTIVWNLGGLISYTIFWTSHYQLLLKYTYSKIYCHNNTIYNYYSHLFPYLLCHILEKCIAEAQDCVVNFILTYVTGQYLNMKSLVIWYYHYF